MSSFTPPKLPELPKLPSSFDGGDDSPTRLRQDLKGEMGGGGGGDGSAQEIIDLLNELIDLLKGGGEDGGAAAEKIDRSPFRGINESQEEFLARQRQVRGGGQQDDGDTPANRDSDVFAPDTDEVPQDTDEDTDETDTEEPGTTPSDTLGDPGEFTTDASGGGSSTLRQDVTEIKAMVELLPEVLVELLRLG